ncbi:MAG TPA: IS200/IS605 family transposase, partial [Candidatus Paceibacterota bacterium]|nr:IS200/IS605 family transposase [Candidatus Paceibacterota bacterium]
MEDRHIEKSHNKTCLLYHIVCPVKYRREVLTDGVVKTLTETCIGIQSRYDIHFIEIGTDGDHVHLLVQSVPTASPKQIV